MEAKLRAVGAFLQSEGGRDLVEHLASRFASGSMLGGTVEKTYFNLGCRFVVEYLREIQTPRKEGEARR